MNIGRWTLVLSDDISESLVLVGMVEAGGR